MTSQAAIGLVAGLAILSFAGACTQTRYVMVPQGTTPPAPSAGFGQTSRLEPVYCVDAPIGYVVPQDKWDPHLIPCPPKKIPVRLAGGGGKTPAKDVPADPVTGTTERPQNSVTSGSKAVYYTKPDGTTYERACAGSVCAEEGTP